MPLVGSTCVVAELRVEQIWQVSGGHLKHPVTLRANELEWGCMPSDEKSSMFVHLHKRSNSTQRLIFGHYPKGNHNLAHTTVIERLKNVRDEARDALFEELKKVERSAQMDGKIDISFDDDPSKSKPKKNTIKLTSNVCTFMAPPLFGVEGVEVNAIIEPNKSKQNPKFLSVHLTGSILEYLHLVAMHEVSDGVHRAHPRTQGMQKELNFAGLSRVYQGKRKGQYRVSKPHHTTVFFDASDDEDAAVKAQTLVTSSARRRRRPSPQNRKRIDDRHSKRSRESEEAITDSD